MQVKLLIKFDELVHSSLGTVFPAHTYCNTKAQPTIIRHILWRFKFHQPNSNSHLLCMLCVLVFVWVCVFNEIIILNALIQISNLFINVNWNCARSMAGFLQITTGKHFLENLNENNLKFISLNVKTNAIVPWHFWLGGFLRDFALMANNGWEQEVCLYIATLFPFHLVSTLFKFMAMSIVTVAKATLYSTLVQLSPICVLSLLMERWGKVWRLFFFKYVHVCDCWSVTHRAHCARKW